MDELGNLAARSIRGSLTVLGRCNLSGDVRKQASLECKTLDLGRVGEIIGADGELWPNRLAFCKVWPTTLSKGWS
jgi:hypothetical protein